VFGASSEEAARASAGQRRAVEAAMRRRLCVVSGGPGTGKTSTVARVLVLAVEQARAMGRPDPRILLIAPTGKAAAALTEALARNLESVDCDDEVRAAIPRTASTIHRALRPTGGVGAGFVHDLARPLAADFVVVDEASMVDLALMRRLVEAVPEAATLVLMGDADQLASVEAGAVLADVCGDATTGEGEADEVAAAGQGGDHDGALRPSIVRLTHSYRFAADSGIGELSRAIRAGDTGAALAVLADEGRADAAWVESEEGVWPQAILELIDDGYAPLASAGDAASALASLDRFRVLSPHRVGRLGVERLNRRVAGRVAAAAGAHAFEPVLVERNDPAVGLWNGDMGVRRRGAAGAEAPRVHFASLEGDAAQTGARSLSELRLPPHSACWAMSVHKSQGSEFDAVLVVLPERSSPLLTREMLYTAITRARRSVVVWGARERLVECIERRVERRSGLRDALWG
jgi:exodeoxyribonuclease V alpha subunit